MQCPMPIQKTTKVKGGQYRTVYRCGQCLSCRITKRQEWTFRIMMEARLHPFNYFLTLTYNDDDLPQEGVRKDELQRFFKRFRQRLAPAKIRYYAVGEYGDKKGRAHYHACIFSDTEIPIEWRRRLSAGKPRYYWHSPDVEACWYADTVHELPPIPGGEDVSKVASYIAGYILKKLTRGGELPAGKNPEFQLMSRGRRKDGEGGIGYLAAKMLGRMMRGSKLSPSHALYGLESTSDVYMARYAGKKWPLDRYMRSIMLEEFGGDPRLPHEKQKAEERRVAVDLMKRKDHDEALAKEKRAANRVRIYDRKEL